MLQSLRDSLKGTVAVFVIIIFVVPLVLFGVEQLFVGSIGGSDAAKVNGESISARAVQREMSLERQRLQSQFDLPADSPELSEDVLSSRVLNRMVRREALVQAAQNSGMGVSTDAVWRDIATIEAFQTDNRFDYDLFRNRISGAYTPATFLEEARKDFLLRQLNSGIEQTGFVTPLEMQLIASITQQKRSFFAINLPRQLVEDVSVTDEEIEQYYQANQERFMEPETVKVKYLELSLSNLADRVQPDEQVIRSVYQDEVRDFSPDPGYIVAHILIEDPVAGAEQIQIIQSRLADGDDFAELAEEFSDDFGSRRAGGLLGELTEGAFPAEFEAAARALELGEVSGPVETEAGIHFIKLVDVTDAEPPTFEERRDTIARQLSRQQAMENFVSKISQLDELTFGADSLERAAEALDLEVKTSEPFTRQGGRGLFANRDVVNASFAPDVLEQGHNSRVLELPNERAVVLRLDEYRPEQTKPLEVVRSDIESTLRRQQVRNALNAQAMEITRRLADGDTLEQIEESFDGISIETHEAVERSTADVSPSVLQAAFAMPRPAEDLDAQITERVNLSDGGVAIIGLLEVIDGQVDEINEFQLAGMLSQLREQLISTEGNAFENSVFERAKVDINW